MTASIARSSLRQQRISGQSISWTKRAISGGVKYRESRLANSKAGWGRTPLVMATSKDDGKTWTEPVVIEDDPDHGYCYVAIHFCQDFVLLAYCAGGPADGICLARTVIRKIPLSILP